MSERGKQAVLAVRAGRGIREWHPVALAIFAVFVTLAIAGWIYQIAGGEQSMSAPDPSHITIISYHPTTRELDPHKTVKTLSPATVSSDTNSDRRGS